MEKFRVGDIVISTVNTGPTWIVTKVLEDSYVLAIYIVTDKSLKFLLGTEHRVSFERGAEILRHKNIFLARAKHAIQDSETFVLEKNKIIG